MKTALCIIQSAVILCPAVSLKIFPDVMQNSASQKHGRLAFDIGMNNGHDTNKFLEMGFQVVALEANPSWTKRNGERFLEHVRSGQLTILNNVVGETTTNQSTPFFVATPRYAEFSDKNWQNTLTGAASVDRENACNLMQLPGSPNCNLPNPVCSCEETQVASVTCADLIKRYGIPHYLKVDIEGYDGHCMRALATLPCASMPLYLSFEEQAIHMHNVASSRELISLLSDRGYSWKVSRVDGTTHMNSYSPGKVSAGNSESAVGTGPFGEKVADFIHGKVWSNGGDAAERANLKCWYPANSKNWYVCDVHGKFNPSKCVEPAER